VTRRAAVLLAALAVAAPRVAEAAPFAGTVLDGMTLKPIRGAIVTAPDGQTATTNKVGGFRFDDLPAGPIEMAVAADGYEATLEVVDLVDGGIADHIFILFVPGAASEVIEVEEEVPVPPPPSRQDLGRQEIQRIPGSRGDALTAIRNLPGIGSSPAVGNGPSQVVIRGAAPEDSKITIDGIEIPVLYHFFGLQSVLPTEMIDTIEVLPGGFGAEEGRVTGGVINVVTRAEAIAEPEGFAELSFINLAGFVQTPLSKEHGLQLTAGLRRSTIDLILPAVIPDSANLAFTTAPQYYDGQVRLDWRRGEGDRASLLLLGSYDLLSLLNDNLDPNEPDFQGRFDNETQFARLLASWHLKKGRADNRLTFSTGPSGFRFEIGTERYLRFRQLVAELRDDAGYRVSDRLKLRGGVEARWDQRKIDVRFPAPPVEGMPLPGNFSNAPLVDYHETLNNDSIGVYAAADFRPVKSLLITPGVRVDHFMFIDDTTASPRIQATQEVAEDWSIKLAMGAYSRGLEGAESADPDLEAETAFQYVLGGKWDAGEGVAAEASLFYTDKRKLVTVDAFEAQTDPLNSYVNRGFGRSFGGEALVRAKLQDFFGWLAYTVQRSDRIDGPTTGRRLFDFDQTHNLIAVGSYRLGKWQFGGRFQYATGTPTTPVLGSLYLSDVNAFVPVYGTHNSIRLEATHQIDLRVDREWRFRTWNLSAYLDVTNVYAHARVLGYSYNYDFTERQAITDLPIVPAIGLRGSF
jgi:outer membrane receptor protein involved in Fe transport